MRYNYYQCKGCGTGYVAKEKPKRCHRCGSNDFKKSPYPKVGWFTRVRKKGSRTFFLLKRR